MDKITEKELRLLRSAKEMHQERKFYLREARAILVESGFKPGPGGHFIEQLLQSGIIVESDFGKDHMSKVISRVPNKVL